QRDSQQLVRRISLENDLEYAAFSHFGSRTRGLAGEPQQLRDRVTERADRRHPIRKGRRADFERLIEPMTISRQVELTRAARDRAPVLDRVQELGIAKPLHEEHASRVELGAQPRQVRENRLQPRSVYA